jgi:hypothetical protein
MTLVLHLSPATEAKLRERAAREGLPEEKIALSAVEQLLEATEPAPKRRRSILEFRGAGKHNAIGKDAQEYVSEMRDEWDREL